MGSRPLSSDRAADRVPDNFPRGSKTQIRSCGASVVLVDQAAEQIATADVWRTHTYRNLVFGHRWRKAESAMGPPSVVVVGIRRERPIEMAATQDDRPVQALCPDGLDNSFGVGVVIRRQLQMVGRFRHVSMSPISSIRWAARSSS